MAKARRKRKAAAAKPKPLREPQKKAIAKQILAAEAALKTLAAQVKRLRRTTKAVNVHKYLP